MRFALALTLIFVLGGCKHDSQPIPGPISFPIQPAPSPSTPPTVTVTNPGPAAPPVTVEPITVVPTPAPSSGVKRAVLVGINKYKSSSAPTLQGCVNDALAIKAKAISSWGFKEENIVLLVDSQATIARVKEALTKVVSETKTGDSLLYWQSSHGAEDAATADAAGEPDGMNQLVCCYDFAWDRAHELIDKDYVKIFSALPDGVYFNWGSDSCHSGDLSRGLKKKRAVNTIKQAIQPEHVVERVAKAKARGLTMRPITGGLLDVGYISGCKANQLSSDTQDDHGVPGGAMTIYFLKVIDQYKDKPLTAVASELDTLLNADGYGQSPEAAGARKDSPWLK